MVQFLVVTCPICRCTESCSPGSCSLDSHMTLPHQWDVHGWEVLSQNIQWSQNELTPSLHPSSRILHQIQSVATRLADQQNTFTKTVEYYMYWIGLQFEANPHLQVRLKKMSGATPPTPTAPIHWPTRTVEDHQTIIQLEAKILKQD